MIDKLKTFNLIYLASPYTQYILGHEVAVRDSARLVAKLIEHQVRAISPIIHCDRVARVGGLNRTDYNIWLPFCVGLLNTCDALVAARLEGWDTSVGMKYEMAYMRDRERPIFFLCPETFVIEEAK